MVRHTTSAQCTSNPETREKTVNQYRLLREIGRGAYCKVKWAQDDTGAGYAVKVFSKAVLDRQLVSFFDKEGGGTVPLKTRIDLELRILGEHSHPHMIGLVEVIDDVGHDMLYAIMEGMVGGQLMDWSDEDAAYCVTSQPAEVARCWGDRVCTGAPDTSMAGVTVYQEAVAGCLLKQLFGAVAYLHEHGVIHKDLKPDNVMLSLPVPAADARFTRQLPIQQESSGEQDTGVAAAAEPSKRPGVALSADTALQDLIRQTGFVAKIGDFNSAALCALPECLIWDAEGTQQFTPPECFDPGRDRQQGIQGKPRDMWSIGCVLFTMLFGRCPFWDKEPIMLQMSLVKFAMSPDEQVAIPGCVSQEAEDILRSLLCKDPESRPGASSVLDHPWVKGTAGD